jgi:hypothetical protein
VRAPRASAIAERFVGTVSRELLDQILIINRRHAAAVRREFECQYNDHRPQRSLGQARTRSAAVKVLCWPGISPSSGSRAPWAQIGRRQAAALTTDVSTLEVSARKNMGIVR